MPVVPSKSVEKIEFYQTRLSPWTANAAAIGTTSGEVAALADLTAAARAAFNAQQAAQNAARAATLDLQLAVDAMGTAGASILKQIRAKAGGGGRSDESVYPLASIPAPARPSPIGPPGQPTQFTAKLNQNGTLELRWKCPNPQGSVGTLYQLHRRIDSLDGTASEMTYIGTSGQRKFTDTTLPAGSSSITYQIGAMRSTVTGPVAQFNVNFGLSGGPVMESMVTRQLERARPIAA